MHVGKYLNWMTIAGTVLLAGVPRNAWALEIDGIEQAWTFTVGGGYTPPTGGINNVFTDGWNFTVGTGYNFNQKSGVMLEFMSNNMGLESGVLDEYSDRIGAATDGHARMWSVSLSPVWRFSMNRRIGAYLIGGGGYYHLNAQVTTPALAYVPPYCDPYWGCWVGGIVPADKVVAEHKDDTGGVNFGGGLTFNLGSNGMKLYVESRYHYVLTSSRATSILPVTVGLRF